MALIKVRRAILAAILGLAAAVLLAQSGAPALGQLVEGSNKVTGQAAQGSAPIAIYDVSTAVKTKIGTAATVADDGSFSCPVRPALIKGHQIVAVSQDGQASVPVTVVAAN
jgi:hypothetical protein